MAKSKPSHKDGRSVCRPWRCKLQSRLLLISTASNRPQLFSGVRKVFFRFSTLRILGASPEFSTKGGAHNHRCAAHRTRISVSVFIPDPMLKYKTGVFVTRSLLSLLGGAITTRLWSLLGGTHPVTTAIMTRILISTAQLHAAIVCVCVCVSVCLCVCVSVCLAARRPI